MPSYINFVFAFYLWVDLKVHQADSEDSLTYFYNLFCKKPAPPLTFFNVTTPGDRQHKSDRGVTHSSPAGSQAGSQAARQPALTVTCQRRFSPDKAHILGSVRPLGVNTGVKRTRLRHINQVKAICRPEERVGRRGR